MMKTPDVEELPEGDDEWFQKIVEVMPLRTRLAGLTLEERMTGLTPEQREEAVAAIQREVAGYTPAQLIRALPLELLRALPEDYIRSLPVDAQEQARERLQGAEG